VSLPVIAVLRDGGFLFISKVTDHEITALQLALPRCRTLTRAEFETAWDGRLMVIEHRGSLSSFGNRLVSQLISMAARGRVVAQRVGQFLMPVATEIDEPPVKPVESAEAHPDDPGLAALVMLLRCHGVGVDSTQIRHRCGTATVGVAEMLRCAKELGLKARAPTTKMGAAGEHSVTGDRGPARRWFSHSWEGW
jgi:subfamily B ATP-binding cassette protein HlyB/CyaB